MLSFARVCLVHPLQLSYLSYHQYTTKDNLMKIRTSIALPALFNPPPTIHTLNMPVVPSRTMCHVLNQKRLEKMEQIQDRG